MWGGTVGHDPLATFFFWQFLLRLFGKQLKTVRLLRSRRIQELIFILFCKIGQKNKGCKEVRSGPTVGGGGSVTFPRSFTTSLKPVL